jgi:PST family polysaccharide transporter
MRALRQSAIRSLPWALLESACVSALLLVTALVLARIIGPVQFGIAALAITFVQVLNILVENLFHDALVQRQELTPSHVDTAFCTSLAVGALLALAVWISAPALSHVFSISNFGALASWASLSLLTSGAGGVLTAVCRRQMQFREVALRVVVARVSGAAVAIAMAYAGYGAWSLVGQHLIAEIAGTTRLWIFAERRPRLSFSPTHLLELSRFAVLSASTQLVLTANIRICLLLLGRMLGPSTFGYFSIAVKCVDALWLTLMNSVANVSLVLFSRVQSERAQLRDAFVQATRLTTALIIPAFAGLALCADLLVRIVLGERWLAAAPVIQVLCVGSILAALRYFAPLVYRAVGRPYLHLISTLLGFAFCVTGIFLFGRDGLLPAACVWAGSVLLNIPLSVLFIRRLLDMRALAQFRGPAPPLAATAIMALAVFGFRSFAFDWPPAATLACSIALGAAIYSGSLWLLAPRLLAQLVSVATELTSGSRTKVLDSSAGD